MPGAYGPAFYGTYGSKKDSSQDGTGADRGKCGGRVSGSRGADHQVPQGDRVAGGSDELAHDGSNHAQAHRASVAGQHSGQGAWQAQLDQGLCPRRAVELEQLDLAAGGAAQAGVGAA